MRVPVRSLATLVLAVGVATCADAPTVGRARTGVTNGAPGRGTIAMAPVFSQSAAAVYAQRATFAGASFDHVRIVLVRPGPPPDTLRDTTIVFAPGSAPQTVEFTVDVAAANEAFTGAFDYTNNGQVVYHGSTTVVAHGLAESAPPQQAVVITYVGPGANVTRLVVAPKTVTVVAPGSATFTVTGFDASNAPVANNPVSWSVSDPTVATISAAGVLSTTGKRGVVTVSATSIAGPSDAASATVTLPPAAIALVSGGGQTGKAGGALPLSATVKVTAKDGVGVAGVPVNFAAPSDGAVGSSSVTTDQNGAATTSLTLGGAVGPQSFAAVAGTFSVSIPATATPGDPASVAAVSGSGQQDTVKKTVGALAVKVTDKFANGVPGVTVSWARTAGTGSLSGSSSVTGADGTASIGYTLGTTPGVETVTATVSGVTSVASFSVTALPAGPSAIAAASGSGQLGRVQQPLGTPFVVKVTDASGNAVAGVSVSWSATNGTISSSTTTDANGQSSNTMTLGSALGPASATATVGSGPTAKSVTFTATVQAGIVAQMAFRVGPPATATAGAVLAPPITIELRDAAGNLTAATNAVSIALGANPGKATLGGTLTVNAVAGVATFNDLTVSNAGNGYTLVASSAGVPNVASAAFNITGAGGDTWTGAVSTDWFTAGNWSAGVPTATTNVVIPAGTQNAPTSNSSASINDLTVATGATLTVGGEATMIVAGNVVAVGNVSNTGGELRMTGAGRTVRGNFSYLSIAGTVSLSGPLAVNSGTNITATGANLTVNTTAASLANISINTGQLTIATGAAATATSLSVYAGGVFSQTGGTLAVSADAMFGGGATTGLITGGTLTVGGNFTQQASTSTLSFIATGTHRVILASAGAKTVTFESPAASSFRDIEIDGPGALTLGSTVTASGALISPAGATPITGGGNQLIVSGLNVDGLTIDNGTIVSNAGTITKFDNVTFQNYPGSATPLTITHPGAATAFTFNNTQFLVTPTSGRYLSITDAVPTDGQVLTINLVNSAPPDGSAQTATSGGAIVNWQSTGATIAWNNPAGGSWSAPANWSLNRVPGPADSVVIALSGTYTVNLDTTFVGKSIVVGGASGAQTLSLAARLLTINNFLTTTGTGFFLASGSTVSGSGTIVNGGKLQLASTTVNAALTNRGPLVISASDVVNGAMTTAAGSSIVIQGDNSFGSAFLSVSNGFTNVGAIQLTSVNGGFASQLTTTTGTLTNAAGGTISVLAGTAGGRTITGAVNNQGTITVAQPLTITLTSAVLTNSGTIDLSTGDMTVNLSGTSPSVTNASSVTVGAGHVFTINSGTFNQTSGTITGAGALNLSGVTATFSNDVTNATTGLSMVNSTINGPGTLTNATGQTLTFTNTTIAASSGLINQGTLIVKGSSTINAAISTVAGSTLQVLGDNTVGSSSLTVANGFTNNGAIQLTSANGGFGATLTINNGTLANAVAGTITSVVGAAGPRTLNVQLDNQGLFTVAQTLTMSRASSTITNSGTIDLTTGDLTINQSGTSPSVANSGAVNVSSGHVFTITNGAYVQTSGTVGGPGTFALSGVAASFTNNITNAATALTITNSTISGPGSLTNAAGQTLTLFSSTIAASATLNNQGTLIVKGSTAVNGPITTVAGSTLRVLGDNTVGSSSLTVANGFTNNAAIELTSANGGFSANLTVTNGTLTNAAAGTISTLAGASGPRTLDIQLDNQGLFTVGQATTMSRASSAITNSGTIDLSAADLTINQSGTTPSIANSGTATVGSGHTFLINNGTYNQTSGAVGGAGAFTLSGVTANFTSNITNATTALNITNSTLNGPGSLTNSGSQTLTLFSSIIAASMGLTNQGTLIIKGSSAINGTLTTVGGSLIRVQGDNTVGSSSLTVANGFTNNAAIELTSANGGFSASFTVVNGTLTNAAAGTITTLAGTAGPRTLDAQLNNQGLFTVGLPTSMGRAGSTITNSGTVDLSAGDLTINQSGTTPSVNTSGLVTIGSGHTLLINNGTFNQTGGGVTGSGTFSVSGVTANFTGSVTNATTALSVTNSTINGPGTVTNATGQTLTLFSSTIAASAAFTNQGTLIVKGASAINSAVTTVVGSMIRVQGDNTVGNSTLTVANGFTNNAAIELTSANGGFGANMAVTNGTLTNAAGASITAVAGTGGPRTLDAQLDNQGQFTVALPMTMGRASSVFTSSGTVDLGAGDLTISQSGTTPSVSVSGPVNLANGHAFTINNGTFNLNVGGSVSGVGTFSLSGVTANFALSYTNASTTLSVTNATLNGPGTITNVTGQSLTLLNSTITAPLVNQGTLIAKGTSAINGTLTTQGSSILRVQGDNTVGTTTLTVANGFTNTASIDLTSVAGGFGANMNVTNGTLVNANGATITASAGAGGPRSLNAQFDNQAGAFLNVALPTTINRANSTYANGGTIVVSAGSLTITQSGAAPSFTNTGTFAVATGQSFTISGGGAFTQQAGATLNGGGTFTVSGGTANINAASMGPAAVVLSSLTAANFAQNFTTNGNLTIGSTPVNGAITITNAAGQTLMLNGATIGSQTTIVNQGTLIALGSTNLNGSLNNTATATMRVQGDPTGAPSNATFTVANGPSFANLGALEMTSVSGGFQAVIQINTGTFTNSGTLTTFVGAGGARQINGAFNNTGTIAIGVGGTGTLSIGGAGAAFTNSGTVNIKLNGTAAGAFDQLAVAGSATFGTAGPLGVLNVSLVPGFTPTTGNAFNVITYTSHVNNFATYNLPSSWVTPTPGVTALTVTAP